MSAKVVDVKDISPSIFNAREPDSEQKSSQEFIDLCDSIRSEDVLEPIIVRQMSDGKYEAISGTRRLAALKHVGTKQTTVIVRKMDDNSVRIASLVENIHRKSLGEREKRKTLEAIYLATWDEWKPDNPDDIMPREKDTHTGEVKYYDLDTDKGKLVLATQYLMRINNEDKGHIKRNFTFSKGKIDRRPQEIFPTAAFRELRQRVGYAASTQVNILKGFGSIAAVQNYIEELPPILRKQFEENERIRKLSEDKKRELAKRIHQAAQPKPRPSPVTQRVNKATDKFFEDLKAQEFKRLENVTTPFYPVERQKDKVLGQAARVEQTKEIPKLEVNPVRARQEVKKLCAKLFKVLTAMDLNTDKLETGEIQAKSVQATNCMKEIATFYIRDRELASLRCFMIPTLRALSTFKDLVYESEAAQKRKDDMSRP